MNLSIPNDMSRRHFMQHMATAAATVPALNFLSHLQTHAAEVKKNQKACILMWMGGGPPTIDIWDLKPGSKNGGEFKPINTKAPGVQISEHMPKTAMQFQDLSIVRSMSTREADHGRGRYFMHTAFVPNPTVVHPDLRLGRQLRSRQKTPPTGNPGVRVHRRRSGQPGLHGHDACSVRCGFQRQHQKCQDGLEQRPAQPAAGDARCRRIQLHQLQARRNPQSSPRSVRESRQPDDLRSDGRLQSRRGKAGSRRSLRQQQLRQRPAHGPPARRNRRAVCGSQHGRLGLAQRCV